MKRINIIFVLLLIETMANAQLIIPTEKAELNDFNKKKIESIVNNLDSLYCVLHSSEKDLKEVKSHDKNTPNYINDLTRSKQKIKSINDKVKEQRDLIEEFNDSNSVVQFFAGASINSSDDSKDLAATSRLSAKVNITNNLKFTLGYNVRGIKPDGISKDSLDLISLMFPEAGSTGYLMSLQYDLLKSKQWKARSHKLSPYFEFAFKQIKVEEKISDSLNLETVVKTINFSSLNYNAGLRYNFIYTPNGKPYNTISIIAQLYFNFFNVPNEDEKAFYSIVNDKFSDSNISSVGFKTALTYKNFTVFGDFRNNIATSNLKDDDVFKGFVFNIGTMINTQLLKL